MTDLNAVIATAAEGPAPQTPAGRAGPRTPTEALIETLWSELLNLDDVRGDDNFFALGGHSLLATRLINQLRGKLDIELSLGDVFEAPTLRALAQKIDELQKTITGVREAPILAARPRGQVLPLSFAQERLWLLHQLEATAAAYNVLMAFRFSGVIDVATLEWSFAEVVRRHEVLRTRHVAGDGRPEQIVDARSDFQLAITDLFGTPDAEEGALRRRIEEIALIPFDLSKDAGLRVELLRVSLDEHILVVILHHIVFDGWSQSVLIRELRTLYAARVLGRPSPLVALPLQYADYALWQREWMRGAILQAQIAYWRTQLLGAPAALELPTDRMRPAVQNFAGATVWFDLSNRTIRALSELAEAQSASLFMVLLAAFQLLLSRHCGQNDIVVGTPVAGRKRAEIEDLIGFFVNMLALRTEIRDDLPFRQLLERVKRTTLDAFAHDDLPFENVVEELRPERDLSRQPIFQVLFALQNMPQENLDLPGVRVEFLSGETSTSKFDLSLYFWNVNGSLRGQVEYSTQLFEKTTIESLVDHLKTLLNLVGERPDRKVADLKARLPRLGTEISVSANFTADLLLEPLRLWLQRVGVTARVTSTGYDQVVQALILDQEDIPRNPSGFHVILLRLEDWGRRATRNDEDDDRRRIDANAIERNVEDFIIRLGSTARSGCRRYFLAVCPRSPATLAVRERALRLDQIERRLMQAACQIPQVRALPLEGTMAALGLTDIHDQYLDELAGIPYSQGFFVVLATAVMRAIIASECKPSQALVIEADTLWRTTQGIAPALDVTAPRRMLQEFILRLRIGGVNVCLWEPSGEAIVSDAALSSTQMVLAPHDIALRGAVPGDFAKALDMPLENLVFFSTTSAESLNFAEDHPEALTMVVPESDEELSKWLMRLWMFDERPTAEQTPGAAAADQPSLESARLRFYRLAAGLRSTEEITGTLSVPVSRSRRVGIYAAPRTDLERALAEIWASVLRLERVGIHDNFFALGGHSLVATRVIARVREALSVELPLRAMFEAPTVAELSVRVEAARQEGAAGGLPPLRACERPERLPLSYAQERLWFLDQLQPGGSEYNLALVVRLHGGLEVGVLERCFAQIVQRHEALRTRFENAAGRAAQVVEGADGFRLEVESVLGTENGQGEAQWRRRVREEVVRGFDLARGPLLRVRVLRLAADDHVVVTVMHHIVSDGWSMRLLGREIAALYGAFRQGQESPLAPLPVQYADYAIWQREWLQGEVLEGQLSYWRERLAGAPVLELPTDRPRPAVQRFRGASVALPLPQELTASLGRLARGHGATTFMVLLAAFQVVVSRWSGQDDIVIGTPIAGRRDAATEKLIGFFVNTLVLRTDLSGDPTFRELLGRVKETALGAYAHQDVPFEKLVEVLQPVRDLSRHPLFQVLFNSQDLEAALEPAAGPDAALSGLRAEFLPAANLRSKFDLTLYLHGSGPSLTLYAVYNPDLFEERTVERLLAQWRTVLQCVERAPDCRLSELDLLGGEDRERLLHEWNDTALAYPLDRPLHELFSAQAARTPGAMAVACEGNALSYRALEERSNRLAHHLRGLGVGQESVVGILVERSVEMVVCLLAVLKAGGAYLPLDPGYPRERLGYMLADTRARAVITQQALCERLPEHAARVIRLDADAAAIARAPAHAPASGARVGNLAYIIYTSGSTGRPKGVMVEHRQVLNYVFGIRHRLPMAGLCNFAMVQSFTVGSAITVLYPPLLFGGCLHVISRERSLDAAACAAYFIEHRIDCLKVAPSHLAALTAASGDGGDVLASLVVVAGEACPTNWIRQLCAQRPASRIFNHYGTTETTIGVLACPMPAENEDAPAVVPLGRPLPNCRIYILDKALNPVPPGVIGEIHVAGDSLTRGYLGGAALTAERFIPDPFGERAGARLYSTKDVGRWLGNGVVQYLGRVDHQVKVRGFRVELGEVEAALLAHASVQQAAVVVQAAGAMENRLVAYVVARAGENAEPGPLLAHLKARLPEYMVPAAINVLPALPRTAHGKVDRQALVALAVGAAPVQAAYVAPRSAVEQTLAHIWREILQVERVGIGDHFFALGGHSLMATRVAAALRQALNIELPLRTLFEAPVLADLAECIETLRWAANSHAQQTNLQTQTHHEIGIL